MKLIGSNIGNLYEIDTVGDNLGAKMEWNEMGGGMGMLLTGG